MLSTVFSTAFATMRARWLQILGSTVASMLLLFVVAGLLLMPAYRDLTGGVNDANAQLNAANAQFQSNVADPLAIPDPTTGAVGAGAAVDSTAQLEMLEQQQKAALESATPGKGAILKLVIAMILIYMCAIAASSSGVFAAAGLGVKDSIVQGARTTPHAIVQTLRISWPAMAAYFAGVACLLVVPGVGKLIAIPLYIAGMVLALRFLGTTMLAIGSIAHGNVSFDPVLAREASEGRRWNASGVALVGTIVSGILNIIPFVGTIFLSAFLSAMWEEYGDATPPREADALPTDPYGQQAAHGAGEAVATGIAAPHVAVAAAVAVPAATAAPQLVAGPTWNGVAAPQQPAGAWITLAAPANIGVQVQWTSGAAPAVMVADQAGTWSTPAGQPTTPGEATWIELPAGNSWVAIVPRGAEAQQVWAATWLPAGAAAAA